MTQGFKKKYDCQYTTSRTKKEHMGLIKPLEILPTTIYEFKVPSKLNQRALELVKKAEWENRANRQQLMHYGKSLKGHETLHKKEEWKFFVDWLQGRVDEVYEKVGFQFCDQMKICLMWANRSDQFQWHEAHIHPWSILSGIVYLQADSGKTWFSRENDYVPPSNTIRLGIEKPDKVHTIYKHPLREKTGLIFPSKLTHSVDANESATPRYSIAFNTFPTGAVGEIEALAGLYLEVL